jgi:hypothetical protein
MAATAKKTDPKLWERVKKEVTGSEKGGRKGQWSARKAQLASAEYKKKGGGYKGPKTADNHLSQWTKEEWNTKSGRASRSSGERYLPRKSRERLSDEEYARTTAKKRRDTAAGKQFSSQPRDVAEKAARSRKTGTAAASATAKRRPPARAAPKRGTAATPRAATTGRRAAAPAKPTTRKPSTRKAPARKTPARKAPARKAPARKAAPAKTAARKGATAKRATTKGATTKAAGRQAGAAGAARKPAARKPAAKRRTVGAATSRSTKGGSKR